MGVKLIWSGQPKGPKLRSLLSVPIPPIRFPVFQILIFWEESNALTRGGKQSSAARRGTEKPPWVLVSEAVRVLQNMCVVCDLLKPSASSTRLLSTVSSSRRCCSNSWTRKSHTLTNQMNQANVQTRLILRQRTEVSNYDWKAKIEFPLMINTGCIETSNIHYQSLDRYDQKVLFSWKQDKC